MENRNRKTRRNILWAGVILVLVCAVIFLSYKKEAVQAELNNLKLIPIPERFTELYFDDASSLPRQTVRGQQISFAFTVHNVEGATTTYPYTVYFQYALGYKVVFASSTMTLAPDESTTTIISHVFSQSNETGKVVVNLTSLDQSIDFLLPDTN
jgi:hypothetical protein